MRGSEAGLRQSSASAAEGGEGGEALGHAAEPGVDGDDDHPDKAAMSGDDLLQGLEEADEAFDCAGWVGGEGCVHERE